MIEDEELNVVDSMRISHDFSFNAECSVTGKNIPYYISVWNRLFLSEEGIDCLINFINSDNKIFERDNCSFSKANIYCDYCNSSDIVRIEMKSNDFFYLKCICSKCLYSCKKEFDNLQDYLVYNSDKVKIIVKDYKDSIYDAAFSEEIDTDGYVLIKSKDRSGVRISLSNIFEFQDGLSRPHEYSFISEKNKSSECDVCMSVSETTENVSFGLLHVCKSCRSDIWRDLDDFTESNKAFLVSRKI